MRAPPGGRLGQGASPWPFPAPRPPGGELEEQLAWNLCVVLLLLFFNLFSMWLQGFGASLAAGPGWCCGKPPGMDGRWVKKGNSERSQPQGLVQKGRARWQPEKSQPWWHPKRALSLRCVLSASSPATSRARGAAASHKCLLIPQALASLRKLKAQRVQPGPPYFKETSSWSPCSGARGHLEVCKLLKTLLTTCSERLSMQGNRKVAAQLVVLWQTLL